MAEELYRDIPGYEGLYQITSFGRIVSTGVGKGRVQGRVLKLSKAGNGYIVVRLHKNGAGKTFTVHRLVVEVFLCGIQSGMDVNHVNGIKTDNRIENLEIATRSENMIHAINTGLSNNFGESHKTSKISESDVVEIRKMHIQGVGPQAIGRKYGLKHSTIWAITTRRTWKHVE